MKRIETAAVFGAGAIGAYFIWGLSDKLGENLYVIAEGERKERLEREGLWINQKNFALNVKTPREAHGVDLLLVSTKYGALRESLEDIAGIVDEHTIVMSLLNGVDSEEIIGERIGMQHMVYSLMKISSERRGNRIFFDGQTAMGVYFGEKGIREKTGRVQALEALFADTELHYKVCEDIETQIWIKYAFNVGYNLPQAILGCGIGAYKDSEYVRALRDKLRAEVAAVAGAKGIDISGPKKEVAVQSPVWKRARYSTLQDLDAKRPTEVDMFAGAMMRMGRELGVPTPVSEVCYYMIKALEEKNEGKFEYECPAEQE